MKRVVATLVLAAFLVLAWLARSSSFAPAVSPHGTAEPHAHDAPPAHGAIDVGPRSLAREDAGASPALVASPASALWTVRGTCLDAQGAGVAGVRLALAPSTPAGGFDGGRAVVASSVADGRFELSIPAAAGEWSVEFGRGSHAIVRRTGLAAAAGEVTDLGVVVMVPGRSLVCAVADADGRPLGARTLVLTRQARAPRSGRPAHEAASVSAVTSSDGSCRFERLLPGDYEAELVGELLGNARFVVAPAGEGAQVVALMTLAASATWRVRGEVLRADGVAAAGAEVVGRQGDLVIARTVAGDDGRFSLVGSPIVDAIDIAAWAPGHDVSLAPAVRAGAVDLVLRLPPGVPFELSVLEHDGAAAKDFQVTARRRGACDGEGVLRIDSAGASTAAGDARPLQLGAVPQGRYDVWIRAQRLARPLPEARVVDVAPGAGAIAIVLPQFAMRRVVVVDGAGTPVAECRVEVCAALDASVTIDSRANDLAGVPPTMGDACVLLDQATTDEHGAADLAGPLGRQVALRIVGSACEPAIESGVWSSDELRLVVQPRAHRYQLVVEPQATVAALLAAWPTTALALVPFSRAERAGLITAALAQPLRPPFTPQMGCAEAMAEPVLVTPVGRIRLPRIEKAGDGPVRVDVAAVHPAELRGSVTVDGSKAAYGTVRVERIPEDVAPVRIQAPQDVIALDGEGGFRATLLPGRYRLFLLETTTTPGSLLGRSAFDIGPGESRRTDFKVDHGSLRLTLRAPGGGPAAGLDSIQLLRSGDRSLVAVLPATDAAGVSGLARCEAGDFLVRVLPKRLGTPGERNAYWRATNNPGAIESAYLGVSSLAVAGGATTTVVIDLPAEWAQ